MQEQERHLINYNNGEIVNSKCKVTFNMIYFRVIAMFYVLCSIKVDERFVHDVNKPQAFGFRVFIVLLSRL